MWAMRKALEMVNLGAEVPIEPRRERAGGTRQTTAQATRRRGRRSGSRGEETQRRKASARAGVQREPEPPAATGGMTSEAIAELKQLGQLHDQGVLTDEEFAAQKAKLLG